MLSLTKRAAILAMHEEKRTRTEIALKLGLSTSTVARVVGAHERKPSPYTVAAHRRRQGKEAAASKADAWLGSK